jgi:hypothetical protein
MKAEYSVNLLNGNHGVWLFVSKNGKVVLEQAGIKTAGQAIDYAKAVIEEEEKQEAQKAKTPQGPDNLG